jgi:sugar/nucleoside kinase (ribokinase family)
MNVFDFIAIGDITTDTFISLDLNATHMQCKDGKDKCFLCVRFGDKVPYKAVDIVHAVGNSPNASVSAHRLGLCSALVTNIGNDEIGKANLAALKAEGVDTSFVDVHRGKLTNNHFVLRYNAERTILVKHEHYEYSMPDVGSPKFIYLSSIGEEAFPFHDVVIDYLEKHPDTKLAFQPGTFQIKMGYEKLKRVYINAELFFCNVEEAQRILDTTSRDIKILLTEMSKRGPKISVITDGPKGAYAYDGNEAWHMPMFPDPKKPVDRTGAGDSFSSTFTSALTMGKTVAEALQWGPINSMSVVQHIGAQKGLLSKTEIEETLKVSPKDYKATKFI